MQNNIYVEKKNPETYLFSVCERAKPQNTIKHRKHTNGGKKNSINKKLLFFFFFSVSELLTYQNAKTLAKETHFEKKKSV